MPYTLTISEAAIDTVISVTFSPALSMMYLPNFVSQKTCENKLPHP